jgi:hypothetical protein
MFGGWIFTRKKYKYARGKKRISTFKNKKRIQNKSKKLGQNKRKKYKGGTSESCNLYGFSGNSDALGMPNLRI